MIDRRESEFIGRRDRYKVDGVKDKRTGKNRSKRKWSDYYRAVKLFNILSLVVRNTTPVTPSVGI